MSFKIRNLLQIFSTPSAKPSTEEMSPKPSANPEQAATIISHQLKSHLDCIPTKQPKIVCIGGAQELRRAKHQIQAYRQNAVIELIQLPHNDTYAFDYNKLDHLRNIETVVTICESTQLLTFDIVLLCGENINNVNVQHTATGVFKTAGMIVCSCFSRPLFMSTPTDTAGLTYPGIFTRVGNLADSMRIEGDYLEFGVFDGRTITLAWHCMHRIKKMRFFAFDSYMGISGGLDAEKHMYPDGSFFSNLPTLHHNLKVAHVDQQRIIPVPGDFNDSLKHPQSLHKKLNLSQCLVAHFDADVYQPTKLALDFVTDLLVQGSILLFDEFHANAADNSLGERRALSEWLESNPHIKVERYHDYASVARAYIVHVND